MRLFVDHLCNVDFSFLHPERGLLGETWLASVELEGDLDEQGMICDFGIVKATLREWLDSTIDHCLLVPAGSPALHVRNQAQTYELQWQLPNQNAIHLRSPESAVTLISAHEITCETVANWCVSALMGTFPSSVKQLQLRFTPEFINGPFYHYSHGLKKHTGNCQRIAHGHRSKIEIWRNGNLSLPDMQRWAFDWQDIYIGSKSDLLETDANNFHFAYQAQQGDFYLSLPQSRCRLIDTDSTVECIAHHIAASLKVESPQDNFIVRAYEGYAKGAIVEL